MGAYVLATQGARASEAMIVTLLDRNDAAPAH